MKYYIGWEQIYNGYDFEMDHVTLLKSFAVGEIKYTLHYQPHSRIITIMKRTPTYKHTHSLTADLVDNCYFDLLKQLCDEIKAI